MSAFFLFAEDKREENRESAGRDEEGDLHGAKGKEAAKLLGEMWKTLSEEEKRVRCRCRRLFT